jgi:cell division protein FtsW (lipid II flippase)
MRPFWPVGLTVAPSLVLLLGAALAFSAPGQPEGGGLAQVAPVMAAAVAPMLAALALVWIAPGFDRMLLAVAAMLTAVGTSTLLALTMTPDAAGAFYADIAARHGYFVAAGFVALPIGAVAARRIELLRRYPYTLLGAALALTAVTVVAGDVVNGARLWLSVGPLRFQSSELARFLLAAFVAVYLYERRHLVAAAWRVRSIDLPPAPYLLPLGAALLGAVGVLVLQNDLGMAALVALGSLAVVLGVGSSWLLTGTAGALLGMAAVGAYLGVSRVRDRVAGWLDPWTEPAGRGFQFVQAEFAVTAGGFVGNTGRAPTAGVPEVHTDLILTAVGTHFGLLGALAVLALAGLLVCRCLLAAMTARDGFSSVLALSIGVLLAIQIVLIAGGALRVLPLTGLTFPLLSYGGTSIIVTLFAVGVELGIGAGDDRPRGLAAPRRDV